MRPATVLNSNSWVASSIALTSRQQEATHSGGLKLKCHLLKRFLVAYRNRREAENWASVYISRMILKPHHESYRLYHIAHLSFPFLHELWFQVWDRCVWEVKSRSCTRDLGKWVIVIFSFMVGGGGLSLIPWPKKRRNFSRNSPLDGVIGWETERLDLSTIEVNYLKNPTSKTLPLGIRFIL